MKGNWVDFGYDEPRYDQADRARLVSGDGIAIAVQVWDGERAMPARQLMTLRRMDAHSFAAEDVNGLLHKCRWDQAVAWMKRPEPWDAP